MRIGILFGVWAGLLCAGCAHRQTAAAWSAEDRAAVASVLAKAKGVRTLTLNLGDPATSRFLKRHFEISGISQQRYPGFHQLLAEQSVKMAATGVSGPRVTALSDDLTYEDLTTQMLALYVSAPQTYTGSAAASMEAAASDQSRTLQIAYTSMCFYDANNNPIGTCATSSSFGGGQYFPVNNALASANQAFTAVFAATYYDATNKRYVAQTSALNSDSVAAPQQQTISAPVIVNSQNNPLATALVCTSRSVNANANPGVCDYGTYNNTRVLVNMAGSVTYQAAQVPQTSGGKLVGTAAISLINTVQGGGCILSPTISGTNFFQQQQVGYDVPSKTLSWNFNNLDFGAASAIICGGTGTSIQFSLLASVPDTANNNSPIVAAQFSVPNTVVPHLIGIDAGALATPMLRLVAGCLHPDTLITLADGRTVPIHTLKGEGELVRTVEGPRRVVGTTVGDDTEMFAISASNGLSVRATAQHPFVLSDGKFRAAAALQPGDRIRTVRGEATVRSIDRAAYKGKVYNLLMQHAAHEPATLANDSFYADGFLVGGHDAQQQVAQAALRHPVRVEALLPPMLRKDYESHKADGGHAKP